MWKKTQPLHRILQFGLCLFLLAACQAKPDQRQVVVYTSVDQNFSEPILLEFQAKTGIEVLAVYDVEAAKTTGMVNRLITEKDNPQADVFWSGEFAQTLVLKEEGVLVPYRSPNAENIPQPYFDPEGYWTGFAGRARVLIINQDHIDPEEYPASIYDLLDSKWPADKIGIAYPLFGTTATQAAALYAELGEQQAREYFQDLFSRGIRVVDGNSVVRDLVAEGQLWFGLTDTDDACGAIERGDPVTLIFPDQDDGQVGTLIIPNTAALIAGGPHPEEAKELIDFLVSLEVEEQLVLSGWSHVPLRKLGIVQSCYTPIQIKGMSTPLSEIFAHFSQVQDELKEIFIQ
jgi:iron(III) transport system substrate-binding protein